MKKKLLLIATLVVITVGVISNKASAHHADAFCVSTGAASNTWVIVSWDPELAITSIVSFDQAGATVIGGLGTPHVEVDYAGEDLSGTAMWENGNTGPFSGTGDCVIEEPTTTTTEATTSTSTTSSTTTPETTSSTSSVPQSDPTTSLSLDTTSTILSAPSTTLTDTSTPPAPQSSVLPGLSSPTPETPSNPCDAPPGTESEDGCVLPMAESLPETGLPTWMVVYLGCVALFLGGLCFVISHNNKR